MKLILFRHGIAVDREWALTHDVEESLRPLTSKGRERSLKVARKLRGFEEEVDFIVTSPLVRARETAVLIQDIYEEVPLQECVELVPSAPPQAFAQWLKVHSKNAVSLIVVGHEPHLSSFASWALSGHSPSFIELKKSGILCLEFESLDEISPRSGKLSWLMQPKNLLK